jgi:type I site-specific restriction-modification system R (restriction) subunit
MNALNLPTYSFKIKEENNKIYIFDEIRRRYVRLTPEEWVRQNIIKFLIVEKSYPLSLFLIEKQYTNNRLSHRCDFLIYSRKGSPLLLVECKSPSVEITQNVFDQISRYNQQYKAPYLLITNGNKHFCCKVDIRKGGFEFLNDIPVYYTIEINFA